MSLAKQERWTLREMLAEMRAEFPLLHALPRRWAAEVLETVGNYVVQGSSDLGYSVREVGWALVRVYGSFNQEDFQALSKGYMEAKAFFAEVSIQDDTIRAAAAEVFVTVGENIAWGNSISGHSARSVGVALAIIFGISDETAGDFAQGYLEALAYYADGSIPHDLRQ